LLRRLLNLLTALSLLCVTGGLSCGKRPGQVAPRQPVPVAGKPPGNVPAGGAPRPSWVDALVGAIRNDQLIWEIEWPTPDTYKDLEVGPHFSPRGRPLSPIQVLAPWRPWQSHENSPARPPLPLELLAEPLLDALRDPDRWVAAHVVLMHIVLRGEGKTEGQFQRRFLRGYYLKEFMGWPREDFAREAVETYRYDFGDLRVLLRPVGAERLFDYGGSYGGKFTVRSAVPRIDESQMEPLRQWWEDRLKDKGQMEPRRQWWEYRKKDVPPEDTVVPPAERAAPTPRSRE
jgi:hypothetical protein